MYAEQLARKDVEINSLRSKRKELEGRVRQGKGFLQNSHLKRPTLDQFWKTPWSGLDYEKFFDNLPTFILKVMANFLLKIPKKFKKN